MLRLVVLIFKEEGVMGLRCRRQHNDGEQGEKDQCSQAGWLPFRPSSCNGHWAQLLVPRSTPWGVWDIWLALGLKHHLDGPRLPVVCHAEGLESLVQPEPVGHHCGSQLRFVGQ